MNLISGPAKDFHTARAAGKSVTWAAFRKKAPRPVIVIGVFDGLHLGHQYLIKKALKKAKALGRKTICITFHPHPQNQPYLISLNHRLKILEGLNVDYCLVIRCNRKFLRVKARDFIEKILVNLFSASYVFVGESFRFGYKAEGTIKLLKEYGGKNGFKVSAVKELKINNKTVSSQMIRGLIKKGLLREAETFLGRMVSVLGTVIGGFKVARILGYPTANIDPHHEVLPKDGVYVVKAILQVNDNSKPVRSYYGLCNIGRRPTFVHKSQGQSIEAHLFDFKGNIYGKEIEIQFLKRLRPERKFPHPASLAKQIASDRLQALRIITNCHEFLQQ